LCRDGRRLAQPDRGTRDRLRCQQGPPMTDRRKILLVEDGVPIAMEVKQLVEDCGCGMVGPAAIL